MESIRITKSFLLSLLLTFSLVFSISPIRVLAQNQNPSSAGLTPESPFFFLDRLGEAIREFLTFNTRAKARLQINFASERISEIRVILKTKGVKAKGLEVAENLLLAKIARAATILENEKSKGKDISELAKDLNGDFDLQKEELKKAFREEKDALEAKEDELKEKIRAARVAGNTAEVEALLKELAEVKVEKELLELKEDEQEEALEAEEERLEQELENKGEAEKAIQEAEEEKQKVLDEAEEEGVTLPTDVFTKFDRLLSQAKELFEKENFQGAEQLAEQAEKSLDAVEKTIENLEDEKEALDEDLEEELEKQIKKLEDIEDNNTENDSKNRGRE